MEIGGSRQFNSVAQRVYLKVEKAVGSLGVKELGKQKGKEKITRRR